VTEARITLRAGALQVQLLPAVGGCIVRFDRIAEGRRQPLLRGTDAALSDAGDAACFPLVPFANRIRGGTFTCDGRDITLRPNLTGDPSPLHGQGWRAEWAVTEASGDHALLSFHHPADEWPWEYLATQRIGLDANGLSLELSCRNLSSERMPCGLGLHPYYPCTAETLLDAPVGSAWTIDERVLPVENVPATGRYDIRHRHICGQALDNGFDDWNGTASIIWPGEGASLRLSSPDARRFQVYSPAEGGLFVAEPVQNANAALNAPQERWPELGLELLKQGQSSLLHARFGVVTS
jgi:aldose 1-epimerase